MFNLAEYRRHPDRLADLLPWAMLVAPGVVLNKDGSFQRSFRFEGPDIARGDMRRQVAIHAQLNAILRTLGDGWAVYIEMRRRPYRPGTPSNDFPDPASWLIEQERHAQFNSDQSLFVTERYLTLQYLPPSDSSNRLDRSLFGRGAVEGGMAAELLAFEDRTTKLAERLADLLLDVLPLGDDATLAYLDDCVSSRSRPLKAAEQYLYLDAILGDEALVGGVEPRLGERPLRSLSILGLPGTTTPSLLADLSRLAFSFRWMTRWLPLDRHQAEKALTTYRRHWFSKRKGILTLLQESLTRSESPLVDTGALDQASDADEALRVIGDDLVSFGYYTGVVTITDPDPDRSATCLKTVERLLTNAGAAVAVERINGVEAWLSSLPGHAYANVRGLLIHSLNLSHLVPLTGVWTGAFRDRHFRDAPVMQLVTEGHNPFGLPHNIGDIGHKLVIGPTGSGKSAFLAFYAAQFRRYPGARVVIFERGESALVTTLTVGGKAYRLGEGSDTGLQPLAGVDDENERRWALDWLTDILMRDGIDCDTAQRQALWLALTDLARFEPARRTIGALRLLVQDQILRDGLAAWSGDGPYAALLDGNRDGIETADWLCFEIETLLDRPRLAQAVLDVLLHRIDQRFDGTPTLIILDEAWRLLDDPTFTNRLRTWMKTARKANVGVIFATQSFADILDRDIWTAIVESCPMQILLPNAAAEAPESQEIYRRLGLGDHEIQALATAVPKRDYYVRAPEGSRMVELGLGEVALAFCGAGSTEDRQKARKIAKDGNFPADWLAERGLADLIPHLEHFGREGTHHAVS
ncbi:conjugal transfer protein TrbE [Lacibacterium aquatile]|uniref:Conjugal transfer protein TrbE n=1 Tax=Lacibacterium aquatile TaxID=1168082 RepID=A0ABW5DP83_9PROT